MLPRSLGRWLRLPVPDRTHPAHAPSRRCRPSVEALEARLVLSTDIEVEPNNTPAIADLVTVPVGDVLVAGHDDWLNLGGQVATPGDADFFRFTIADRSGVFFDIDARETGLSTTLDAELKLFDAAGQDQLAENDDGFDFDTGFPAPASPTAGVDSALYANLDPGTYLIRVTGHDDSEGTYQLRMLADTTFSVGVPVLASNPTAADTVFLDFDGHTSTGDAWKNGQPYALPAYDITDDALEFSPAERLAIKNIWRIVAEDYSPFAINITTSYAGPFDDGVASRQVINDGDGGSVGSSNGILGVAFIGSYAGFGPSDNLQFTFAQNFGSFGGGISGLIMAAALEVGNTSSHEFGHGAGLNHFLTNDPGARTIMFTPDTGLNREIWGRGTNMLGQLQDDMAIISGPTNTFGYRPDDHGDTTASATVLNPTGDTFTGAGIIGDLTFPDKDFFRFEASNATTITAEVDDYISDLDTELRVYDAAGVLISAADPGDSFDARLLLGLPAGTYFAEVRSDGEMGEAGQYTLRITTNGAAGLAIGDMIVSEGENGSVAAQFFVTLSSPSPDTVTVNFTSSDGTAVAGSDYQAVSGTLTFLPGQQTKTILAPILGDVLQELDEVFFISLTDPVNSTLIDDQGQGMIVNDDAYFLLVNSSSNDRALRYDGVNGSFAATFTLASGLDSPSGLVQGPDSNGDGVGEVLISSSLTKSIRRYDGQTGVFIDEFVPAGSGELNRPTGLLHGPDGNLYVSSFGNDRVLRFNGVTGAFLDVFATGGGLDGPSGLAFGPDGNLYVSSSLKRSVLRFNGQTGVFLDAFVPKGVGKLSRPEGLVFGPDGDLYVSSFNTDKVLRYDGTTGAFLNIFASGNKLNGPLGLIFGPDNQLYVSSSLNNSVKRFDGTTGAFVDTFVLSGSGKLARATYLQFVRVNPFLGGSPERSAAPPPLDGQPEQSAPAPTFELTDRRTCGCAACMGRLRAQAANESTPIVSAELDRPDMHQTALALPPLDRAALETLFGSPHAHQRRRGLGFY